MAKLHAAIQINHDLQYLYECLPENVMRQLQVLLSQPEIDANVFCNLLRDPSMDLVSTICAISDNGSQIDSVCEALIVAFDTANLAGDLIEWIILDEMKNKGRTEKKRVDKYLEEMEVAGARKGILLVPLLKSPNVSISPPSPLAPATLASSLLQQSKSSSSGGNTFFWKQRWAVLKDEHLRIFKSKKHTTPIFEIHLRGCNRIPVKSFTKHSTNGCKAHYFLLHDFFLNFFFFFFLRPFPFRLRVYYQKKEFEGSGFPQVGSRE